jgi:hypothetical protein
MTIFLAIVATYLIVLKLFFRRISTTVAWRASDRLGQTEPDNSDKFDGMVCAWLWPIYFLYRTVRLFGLGVYKIASRNTSRDEYWNRPQPVQNPVKAVRENRIRRQQEQIETRRIEINKIETELNMPLTVWEAV